MALVRKGVGQLKMTLNPYLAMNVSSAYYVNICAEGHL